MCGNGLIDLLLQQRGDEGGSSGIGGDRCSVRGVDRRSGIDRRCHIRGGVDRGSCSVGGVGTWNGSRVDGGSSSIGQSRCSGIGGNRSHNMSLGGGNEESQADEELKKVKGGGISKE